MAEITNRLHASALQQPSTALQALAQRLVLGRLESIERGSLTVILPNRQHLSFGNKGPEATIHIHDPRFFVRLIRESDIGAGESYMAGEWSTPDLVALTRLFLANEHLFDPHPLLGFFKRTMNRVRHAARRNSKSRSRSNIAAHYDLSNEMYSVFLDPTMTYSSAYFTSTNESLEQAQLNKHRALAEKAGIGESDHVLEIGCGWGGFAEFAARTYGCKVTGITLSKAQADHARQRIRTAGLEHLVDIRIEDYRDLQGTFDAVVSIEMLEAVGHEFLDAYFATCDRVLAEQGRAVIQVITFPDQGYDDYRQTPDFIRRFIFPGGHLPSLHAMQNAITRSSRLVIDDVENIAAHYAETLKRWRGVFMSRLPEIHKLGFDKRFCRMWEFYLATCEAAFAHAKLGTLQLVLARPGTSVAEDLRARTSSIVR